MYRIAEQGQRRDWTSVTFLIDRRGVIRHLHPGGQYVRSDRDHEALWAKIQELLRESPPGSDRQQPVLGVRAPPRRSSL